MSLGFLLELIISVSLISFFIIGFWIFDNEEHVKRIFKIFISFGIVFLSVSFVILGILFPYQTQLIAHTSRQMLADDDLVSVNGSYFSIEEKAMDNKQTYKYYAFNDGRQIQKTIDTDDDQNQVDVSIYKTDYIKPHVEIWKETVDTYTTSVEKNKLKKRIEQVLWGDGAGDHLLPSLFLSTPSIESVTKVYFFVPSEDNEP